MEGAKGRSVTAAGSSCSQRSGESDTFMELELGPAVEVRSEYFHNTSEHIHEEYARVNVCTHIHTHAQATLPLGTSAFLCVSVCYRKCFPYLTAGCHRSVQRGQPLVIFGIYSRSWKREANIKHIAEAVLCTNQRGRLAG